MPDAPTIDTSPNNTPNEDGKVTIGGTCRAGSMITVKVDGHEVPGSPVLCKNDNTWALPVQMTPGSHSVTVADGNGHSSEDIQVAQSVLLDPP